MDLKVDVMTTLPVSPIACHHDRTMSTWAVYGRLKPSVTIARARADLERLFAASKADVPLMFRSDTKLIVESLQQHRAARTFRIFCSGVGPLAPVNLQLEQPSAPGLLA
jgi:hypothetical protein